MAKQKKANAAIVVMPTNTHRGSKLMLSVLGGFFVLVIVVAVVYGAMSNGPVKPKQPPQSKHFIATTQFSSGDPAAGSLGTQAAMDAALKKAVTPEQKRDIYLKKVNIGQANDEPFKQVSGYAMQAESLAPTDQTALILGDLYRHHGDDGLAAKYLQLYLSRVSPDYRAAHSAEYDFYVQIVRQLSGTEPQS